MVNKQKHAAHSRLSEFLFLLVTLLIIVLFGMILYATGIFTPATPGAALADTPPLSFATAPPKESSILSWFISSASAEEETKPTAAPNPNLDALLQQVVDESGETPIEDEDTVKVSSKDLSKNTNLPDTWFNVLLMGMDTRKETLAKSRSDVMIIASINAETGEIKLVSLARDLLVDIPTGNIGKNRLNTAFAFGGWQLAVKTINQVFEMNIDYYVAVNFAGVVGFVDTVGGVDIALVGEEWKYINENVAVSEDYEGFAKNTNRRRLTADDSDTLVHLDGLQALGYARIRKMDNDLQRNNRQRILMETMLRKMWPLDIPKMINLISLAQKYCDLNVPFTGSRVGKIITNISKASDITLSELSIPLAGTYHGTVVQDHKGSNMDVLEFNRLPNVQALHEFIYGEYIPAEKK